MNKTQEKKKRGISLWKIVLLSLPLATCYYLFYIPYEQHVLIKKIEKSFEETGLETLKISDFTDFEWDTLCLASMYSWFHFFNPGGQGDLFYGKNYEALRWNLLAGWSPTFLTNLIFIQDGRVVKTYVFDTYGLRYEKSRGWYPYTQIILKDRSTHFWGEVPFKNEACVNRENGALVIDHGHLDSAILVTNIEKDD